MEFQAVIMAGGTGSRMPALTTKIPKALLPVANKPMIMYPIGLLEKAGYKECLVVVETKHKRDIERVLFDVGAGAMHYMLVGIPSEDWGTADSLRHIREHIRGDFIVLSCDVVTDLPLHLLADAHRKSRAYLTVLLGKTLDVNDVAVPDPRNNRKQVKQLIGLDESGECLQLIRTEADLGSNLILHKQNLTEQPHLVLRTDLQDAHVYIMKKAALDLIDHHKKKGSLKAEIIPYIVDHQRDQKAEVTTPRNVIDVEKLFDGCDINESSQLLDELSLLYSTSSLAESGKRASSGTKCTAFIGENQFLIRANSVLSYCAANFMVPSALVASGDDCKMVHPTAVISQKTQAGADSRVGEGSKVGDYCAIKRSVIGQHCVIGDRVKITKSVIMDHVTVEEGVTISGSIICSGATVGSKAELKDCIVGSGESVIAMGKFTNEVIQLEANMDLEAADTDSSS